MMYACILVLVISGCDGEGMKMDRKVVKQTSLLR
jgi:hypothetical protein